MTPKTKEQYAKIREDRTEEILNAALELFARQGVNHATMQDIARKAGISKGLIYNYFTNKEDLLNELIKSFINHLYDYFDPDGDGILSTKEIEYFIEQHVESLKKNIDYYKFLYMLLMQPSAQEMMEKLQLEVLTSKMWKMIGTYFQTHNFTDPESETWIFHTILDGIAMNYVFNPDKYPIDKIKKLVIQKYCKL
ncbi:MAG: TetR/AcrR family transcriptional regulator [Bacteroidia bacterium]|nr:TetR/AcrR family transcriptional regulator [Bacteroidia bacterium]